MSQFQFNALTGQLDLVSSTSDFDSRYVLKSGDSMTGSLNMQGNTLIFTASGGNQYTLTVDSTGAVITTAYTSSGNQNSGVPIGFRNLSLTYP